MLMIEKQVSELIPDFKIGIVIYHHIAIGPSPQMLKGRFRLLQEELRIRYDSTPLTERSGVSEWRNIFKTLKIDPSRFRPSHEQLLRRVKKGEFLPSIHSAVDLNNFFSIQYDIPCGIYDLDTLGDKLFLRLGKKDDEYIGINQRMNHMEGKLLIADESGAFGSPIVDSKKTMTTESTTNALHIFYLKPSMPASEAKQLLNAAAKMFTSIHGGTSTINIYPNAPFENPSLGNK